MRKVITVLGSLFFMSVAQAQMGPAPARAISRPMPAKAPSGVQNFNAEANLIISRKGRVDFAEVVTTSGDPGFDKEWKKSLSEWRFVPAVGADGQPIESHARVTYKNNALTDTPSTAAGEPAPTGLSEPERVAKLTCKDFLWEYYIVTNALPRRLALLDSLVKTPLTLLASEGVDAAQVNALRPRYDDLVNDGAKQCRDNPDALFWTGVFKPILQSALVQ